MEIAVTFELLLATRGAGEHASATARVGHRELERALLGTAAIGELEAHAHHGVRTGAHGRIEDLARRGATPQGRATLAGVRRRTAASTMTPASLPLGTDDVRRCGWSLGIDAARRNPTMIAYHDTEWGVPVHDDRKHYEFLVLDAFQAGLSWAIVLNKRDGFRRAFADFDPERVARFNRRSIDRLLADPDIVRNRQKIEASIGNARALLKLQDQHGSFDRFIWQLVGGDTRHNAWRSMKQVPAKTAQSDAMSKALMKAGFKFVGSTICYAYMQAAGIVNDHEIGCFRHTQLGGIARSRGR